VQQPAAAQLDLTVLGDRRVHAGGDDVVCPDRQTGCCQRLADGGRSRAQFARLPIDSNGHILRDRARNDHLR